MAGLCAVVPVKGLAHSKSRLVPDLGRESARSLVLAMMQDAVAALREVAELDRVVVLTPDPEVAAAARQVGGEVLLRPDAGLSSAVDAAAAELTPGPEDALLVVLGDLPKVEAAEIRMLLAALPGRGVALAPTRDGGTSALLRRPARVIAAGFGPDSARVHRERAEAAGVPLVVLGLESLATDVDHLSDLWDLRLSGAAGPRTQALLRKLP